MQCPLCNYQMTAFDAECPRCHGKGLPKAAPPVSPQPPPQIPYNPTIHRPVEIQKSGPSATSILAIVGGIIGVPIVVFLGLRLMGSNITVQVTPDPHTRAVFPTPTIQSVSTPASDAPVPVIPVSPTPDPDTILSRADIAYIDNMDKVVLETPSEDLSVDAQISVMRSNIRQAQSQLAQVPPTPRFIKSHSLMQDGLRKVSQGNDMIELGKNMRDKQTVDEGVEDIHSGTEIMRQSANELKIIANKIRGR